MNIIPQRGRMYSRILLNFIKALIWNVMITIINFSFNCRVFLLEHIPLHYSDIWRKGQPPWLNFHFSSITTFIKNNSWQTPSLAIQVCSFGFSCGRCIHSCLRIHYKDNLSYKSSSLETTIHHDIYSIGLHELRWFPILKWVFAY